MLNVTAAAVKSMPVAFALATTACRELGLKV